MPQLAARTHAQLIDAGGTGERVIEAALALLPNECRPVPLAQRLDGLSPLLISGASAGPVGAYGDGSTAEVARRTTVAAAVLGGWPEPVAGLEAITTRSGALDL